MTARERAGALAQLACPEGSALLERAASLPDDRLARLTDLRRRWPATLAAVAVELLELRRRARPKFALADRLFFTPQGLEQATSDRIAAYRAGRFPVGGALLDACCGIGSDSLALAGQAAVLAVDADPAAAVCVAANRQVALDAGALQSDAVLHVACADVTRLHPGRIYSRCAAAFFDPSRRVPRDGAARRARNGEDYSPPLQWTLEAAIAFAGAAVKASPGIADEALCAPDAHVEFVSDRGECKEAILWFGTLRRDARHTGDCCAEGYFATVLRPGSSPATLAPFPCAPPPLTAPRAWLFDPDPAVVRAHRVPQLAALIDAAVLEPSLAYLSADARVETPFAAAYRVLSWLPFGWKRVAEELRSLGRRVTVVKRRGVPVEPEVALRRLSDDRNRNGEPAVLVLTRHGNDIVAILCDPATTGRGRAGDGF